MAEHTNLPWRAKFELRKQKFSIWIKSDDLYFDIAGSTFSCGGLGDKEDVEIQKANFEFIVKACNHHYEMLEALKRFVASSACQNGCDENDMSCDTMFAKSLINSIEGK